MTLRDRLLEKLAWDERQMQAEAVPLIGTKAKYGQDGEPFGPGDERLGWSYSPSDMKLFRKGYQCRDARNRALVLALVGCVEALEKNNQMTMWKARAEALAAVEAALGKDTE